jgi:hypothetical protein
MARIQPAASAASTTFSNPDTAHSPAAYWFWHHLPGAEQIREQINQMLEGGFRSFQIQARLAYPIGSYLDADYLAACRVAVEEAARRGMTVGIYDEYNWQSGQAAGQTVRGHDDLRERHVFWSTTRLGAGRDGSVVQCTVDQIHSSAADLGPAGVAWQYDDARVAWTDWQVIAALAYPDGGFSDTSQIRDVTAAARITASSEDGCTVDVGCDAELAASAVTVFVAARSVTSRVPNYLLRQTAERFIEAGYEPFRRTFGDYLGTTVQYVFFDQPHATFHDWPQRHGKLRSSLLYSAELAEAFRAETGRDFGHALLALVTDVGPDTRAIRCDFYQTFTELTFRNYLGTLADWCQEHGLALSGHEVLGHVGSWHPGGAFSSWDLRVNFGLDYFGVDSYRNLTGVDAQDCVPQLSAKMGDSVARSNGRSGCIVEQYMGRSPGAGDLYAGHWGLTLEELRAQAIRLTLSGARQFLFHGFYQTDGTDGDPSLFTNPRFDFPPGINFEPWWPFHRAFADEVARLSVFVDEGAPACDVAVFYPLRTCWAEGSGHSYGDHVAFWTSFLTQAGFGFHLIDERDLLRAEVRDGQLCLDDRSYGCLVLPSVTTLGSLASAEVLAAFASGGGMLVSSGDVPAYLQAGDDEAMRSAWAGIERSRRAGRHFDGMPDREATWQLLAPQLKSHPHATVDAGSEGHLWQWAGRDADGWRLALFNDSAASADVTVASALPFGESQVWDPDAGSCPAWPDGADAVGQQLRQILQPMELRLLRLRGTPAPAEDGTAPPRPGGVNELGADARSVQLRDRWTLRMPGHADIPVPIGVSSGWERQGFAGYSGVGIYSCRFDRPSAGTWRLRLPAVRTAVEVTLNGQLIGSGAWSPFEFNLPSDLLRPTGNDLQIAVYSAAGNKYYSGTPFQVTPEASGLLRPPVLVEI